MGGRLGKLASTLLISLVVMVGVPPASAAGERAMWVWDGPVDGVIGFSISRGITDLYLHTPPGFSAEAAYETFLAEAHVAGLAVHAMAGDPAWADAPGPWTAWVDEVVDHGGFDGFVFDVEPYLHPEWGTKRQPRLIRSYLAGLREAAKRAGNLPVLAAIPFWFDEIPLKRGSLVDHVLAGADGIVVMAYRDHAEGVDGIIEHSAAEASLAGSMGKHFVIGVETGPVGLDKVSFAEEGEAFMEGELQLVEEEYASSAGFNGIAIHHYGAYSAMLP